MVVVGDGERAWNIGNGFGRKKKNKMAFFLSYLDYKAQNAPVSNALGTDTSRILQISPRRSQRSDHGQVSPKAADPISRRSNG